MNDDLEPPPTAMIEHSTCLACGCLCDDIRVKVEGGRIVEAGNACPIGRGWFLAPRPGEGLPASTIDGKAAELSEAIDRAAEILRGAKAPVIWGLSGTTVETAASALAIADRIGAVVDLAGSSEGSGKLAAFQRVGLVSASLGEVKDRADVVVFWGVDPLVTHPRHWERYSVEPRGRFIPEGRAGRFVIVVDSEETETARVADLFVRIDPDRQAETLEVLRALVRGVALDPARAGGSAGVPLASLESLTARLMRAHYGALFFGIPPGLGACESLFRLVRDLNEGRRFVALEMGEAGNHPGASSVLSWQSGAPSAVDFGLGHPRHLPREATLAAMLTRGEVDAILTVADDPADFLRADHAMRLAQVPMIDIAPGATIGGPRTAVAFDVARPGLEAGGTVARVDGVMLPLRPAISSGLPTDRDILEAIGRHFGRISSGGSSATSQIDSSKN
jgi:formylmethanofuran dehydrogenase subunit B